MKYKILPILDSSLKRQTFFIVSGVFCIIADQALKYLARTGSGPHYLIPQLVGWEYFENYGIAFGIPIPHLIVIPLTITIIATGLWYLHKTKHSTYRSIAAALIIAGALSNLYDRMIYGFTIDYIRIFTSILNLADISIVMGIFLLLNSTIKKTKE